MSVNKIKNFILIRIKIFLFIIGFSLSCILLFVFSAGNRSDYLEVIYLDIGQGDSILIKESSGVNFLIDAGPSYIASQKIQKELSLFNKKLDGVLITHSDSDHYGGLDSILSSVKVDNLMLSKENEPFSYIKDNNTKVSLISNNNGIMLGRDFKLKVLNSGYENINSESGDKNSKSVVNAMSYGVFNFIFTGDIDSETERKLVSQGSFDQYAEKEGVNILKIAHHGSETSSSEIFLKKIKPEYCIISVGKNNKYNHPNENVLIRLKKYCKNLYRTDLSGNVYFKTDGKSLKIDTEK